MNKIISVLVFVLLYTTVSAQIIEHYFNDTEKKEGGHLYDHVKYKNSIIIAGRSFDTRKYNPSVMRIDTLGNTIWRTIDTTTYDPYSGGHISNLLVSDGYVYAFMVSLNDYFLYTNKKEIWKIDIENGNILWKKKFYSTSRYDIQKMIDFDADKFLLQYNDSPSYNVHNTGYAFIDKNDGDTLSTHTISSGGYGSFPLAVDSERNIYYTKGDSIFKVTGDANANLIWKTSHSTSLDRTVNQDIYIDSKDSIYLFGVQEGRIFSLGRVVSINKSTGERKWEITMPYDLIVVAFQDMVDKNGFLYIAWTHTYVGTEKNKAWTSKIDKISGQQVWFTDCNYFVGPDGGPQSTISLDVDDNGDVYMTGYYATSSYGPVDWGILKLDGGSGNVVYRKTISPEYNVINTPSYVAANIGLVTSVINNTPYYLGELPTTFKENIGYKAKIAFIKGDPITGNTVIQKFVEGNYRFPSTTIAIVDYPSSKTVVLKQVGRALTVEMYDSFKNILWSKEVQKEYFLTGKNLTVGPNGDIYFSAHSASESNAFPYYSVYPDSAYVYQLSASGDFIKKYTLFDNSYSIYPSQLYADNSRVLVSYLKVGGGMYGGSAVYYYRKIESMQLSNEIRTGFANLKPSSQVNNYFSKDENKAYYFSNDYGYNYVTEFDKNTMMFTSGAGNIYTPLDTVNYVLKVDETHALICANSKYNRESVGLYDFTLKDTVWSRLFAESYNSFASKAVLDVSGKYAYIMSSNNADITIREISVLNGSQVWEYTYNGAANKQDFPLDIVYDKSREQIIVTGYETMADKTTNALILTIDKNGVALDTIIKKGSFPGISFSLCAHVLQDGSQWVGGSLSNNVYGPDGFLYELADAIYPVPTDIIYEHKQNNTSTIVSPNPFSNTTTIKIVSEQKYATMTLTLYNMLGEVVGEFSEQGIASFSIHRNSLTAGMYIYYIREENTEISTGKLIVLD